MTVDTLKAQKWMTFSCECGDEPQKNDMQHLSQKSVTLRNFTLPFPVDVSLNGTVVSVVLCSALQEIPYCKAKSYLLIHKFDWNNWDSSWFWWTSVLLFTFAIFVFWASKYLQGCVLICNCSTGWSGWHLCSFTCQDELETSRGPSQPTGHTEGGRCLLMWCSHASLSKYGDCSGMGHDAGSQILGPLSHLDTAEKVGQCLFMKT